MALDKIKAVDGRNTDQDDRNSGIQNPAFDNDSQESFISEDRAKKHDVAIELETINPKLTEDRTSLSSSRDRVDEVKHGTEEDLVSRSSCSSSLTGKTTSTVVDIDLPQNDELVGRRRRVKDEAVRSRRRRVKRRTSSVSKISKRSPSSASSVSVSIKAKVITEIDSDEEVDKKSVKLTVEANGKDIDPSNIKVDLDDVKDVLDKQTAKNKEEMDRANTIVAKKAVTSGLLDLALLSANIYQFRLVLALGPSKVMYYEFALWLISSSVLLQVFTAVFLMVSGKKDTQRKSGKKHVHLNRCLDFLNSITTLTVFAVTVLNVIITAFAFGLDFMMDCEIPNRGSSNINDSSS